MTQAPLGYVESVDACLKQAGVCGVGYEGWVSQVRYFCPLIKGVIEQTERRVLAGEVVPAAEKVLSLFEPHTDIIVKGSRDVQYGHKLNCKRSANRVCQECRNFVEVAPVTQTGEDGDE